MIKLCKLDVNTLAKNLRSFKPRMEISGQEVRIQAQKLDILGKAREVKGSIERNSNITKKEDIGKCSLLDRVRKGEIVIATTDKSGKLVVSKPETYLEALAVHTSKDEEIDWGEIGKVEKLVNRHMKVLGKCTGLGDFHPSKQHKLAGAMYSVDSGVPPLYIMWKDHKKDFYVKKQTRPVCNGKVGPLARASDIMKYMWV